MYKRKRPPRWFFFAVWGGLVGATVLIVAIMSLFVL